MKRYYLYNFLVSSASITGGHFTMVYFYLHGFSITAIITAVLTYGLTCLAILKPVGILIERLGPQTTFRLHAVAEVAKYLALISIFLFPLWDYQFFLLIQFFNAFRVMMSRIPLTAYFSAYGDNLHRGSQIGLTNNVQVAATVIVPALAGALIEDTGLVLISTISLVVNLIAISVLKFDGSVRVRNPVRFKRLMQAVPRPFTRAFFVGHFPYPFVADLVSIYIAVVFGSFTVLGLFIALRTAVSVLLNYVVGRMTDAHRARRFFFWGALVSSTFWMFLPFIQDAWAIVLLQFTLGLAGLVTSIPFEGAYHNAAKEADKPLEFAVWREVALQSGMVLGCILFIFLLESGLVADWRMLLPLGAISAFAMLFALPYIRHVDTVK
jgi:hypothetical protein